MSMNFSVPGTQIRLFPQKVVDDEILKPKLNLTKMKSYRWAKDFFP